MVARSVYGHVIIKFSRMGRLLHFLTHSGLLARFTCESSAIKEKLSCEPSLSYNRKIIRFFIQVFSFFTLLRVVLEIVLTKICPHLLKIFRGISGGLSKIGEFLKPVAALLSKLSVILLLTVSQKLLIPLPECFLHGLRYHRLVNKLLVI